MSPIVGFRGGLSADDEGGEFLLQKPLTPTIGTPSIYTTTQVYVYFTPNPSGSKATSYNVVIYCINTGTVVSTQTGFTSSPALVSYSFTANYTYEYAVQAVNDAGTSALSAYSSTDVPYYIPPPYTPPYVPPPYTPPYVPPPYTPPPYTPPYVPPPYTPPYAPPPYAPPKPPPYVPPYVPPPVAPPYVPPPHGGGCYVEGSPILMADGTYKNIENIVPGDVVKSIIIPTFPNGENASLWFPASIWSIPDLDIGSCTYDTTIVNTNQGITASGYFCFNNRVKLTGEHFVFINRQGIWQFVRAWSIQVGDIFLTEQMTEENVETIDIVAEDAMVFMTTVGPNDLFIGGGILTHNNAQVKSSAL